MKSFVSRRVMAPFEVDSSVTKENRTRWQPSRGMRVRVDFASLDDKAMQSDSNTNWGRKKRPFNCTIILKLHKYYDGYWFEP